MGKFTITHEINCNADTFWKWFFDKDFNVKLYKSHLGFPDYDVVDQKETDTTISRKAVAQPRMDVPSAVAKVIGPGFRYTEEGTMTKSDRRRQGASHRRDEHRGQGLRRGRPPREHGREADPRRLGQERRLHEPVGQGPRLNSFTVTRGHFRRRGMERQP
jgi:hypothetical protein